MSWVDKFKNSADALGRTFPKDSPVIGISEDGYEIRKNNNGYFGGGYLEWYYIFIDDKPVITDKYGVPKEKQEKRTEIDARNAAYEYSRAIEEAPQKNNIFIFVGLGVLIYIFLKKR